MFFAQAKFVFFPTRALAAQPGDVGLDFEELRLELPDGTRAHGWLVPHPDPRAAVVFCHGNGGNISHRLDTLRILHRLRLTTLIFDYTGYGKSDGSPSEAGVHAATEAAWRRLREMSQPNKLPIIMWGRSLGSAAACELAGKHEPAALIVESAFPSMVAIGQRLYPWLPVKLLSRYSFDAASAVSRIRCAKLFFHSRGDDIVPFELGRELFDRAAGPKRFVELEGGHNEGFLASGSSYIEALESFLDEHLK